MKSIIAQVEATTIDTNNLLKAMGAVESLEKLKTGKDISVKIELRCKDVAVYHLKSVYIVSKFVTENCDNIGLVMRLLRKCEGSFKDLDQTHLCKRDKFCEPTYNFHGRSYCKKCNLPVFPETK